MPFQLDEKLMDLMRKVIPVHNNQIQPVDENDSSQSEEENYVFNEIENSGLLQKLKSSKEGLAATIYTVDKIFDTIEKIHKLIIWEDHDASETALLFLLIVFLILTFIPLRLIICIGIFLKFRKGSTYYKRRWTGNRECCRIEIRNFFLDHKYYPFEVLFSETAE